MRKIASTRHTGGASPLWATGQARHVCQLEEDPALSLLGRGSPSGTNHRPRIPLQRHSRTILYSRTIVPNRDPHIVRVSPTSLPVGKATCAHPGWPLRCPPTARDLPFPIPTISIEDSKLPSLATVLGTVWQGPAAFHWKQSAYLPPFCWIPACWLL